MPNVYDEFNSFQELDSAVQSMSHADKEYLVVEMAREAKSPDELAFMHLTALTMMHGKLTPTMGAHFANITKRMPGYPREGLRISNQTGLFDIHDFLGMPEKRQTENAKRIFASNKAAYALGPNGKPASAEILKYVENASDILTKWYRRCVQPHFEFSVDKALKNAFPEHKF